MGKRTGELIEQNSRRSREFLESARFMSENEMERDAITDLYYAMYHSLCCLVSTKEDDEGFLLDHQAVIQFFGRNFCLDKTVDEKYYFLIRLAYDEEFYEDRDHLSKVPQLLYEERLKDVESFIKMVEAA